VSTDARAWASHISAFSMQAVKEVIGRVWQTARRLTLKPIRLIDLIFRHARLILLRFYDDRPLTR